MWLVFTLIDIPLLVLEAALAGTIVGLKRIFRVSGMDGYRALTLCEAGGI
jgi:hypothetical protein